MCWLPRRWGSVHVSCVAGAMKRGDDAFPGYGNARDKEMMLLRRKLKKVEQERDFLKEAAAYFAKESK